MSDDLTQLSDEDREYLAVLDATGSIASLVLGIPLEPVRSALATGQSALDEVGAPEDAVEDVRKQLEFLRAFLTFREALEQFATPVEPDNPASAMVRAPGEVSPGGVVLP